MHHSMLFGAPFSDASAGSAPNGAPLRYFASSTAAAAGITSYAPTKGAFSYSNLSASFASHDTAPKAVSTAAVEAAENDTRKSKSARSTRAKRIAPQKRNRSEEKQDSEDCGSTEYPEADDDDSSSANGSSKKRKIVSNACAACRKAHTCCDNQRPCRRCKRLDLACEDIPSGKKRGGYRPRKSKKSAAGSLAEPEPDVDDSVRTDSVLQSECGPISSNFSPFVAGSSPPAAQQRTAAAATETVTPENGSLDEIESIFKGFAKEELEDLKAKMESVGIPFRANERAEDFLTEQMVMDYSSMSSRLHEFQNMISMSEEEAKRLCPFDPKPAGDALNLEDQDVLPAASVDHSASVVPSSSSESLDLVDMAEVDSKEQELRQLRAQLTHALSSIRSLKRTSQLQFSLIDYIGSESQIQDERAELCMCIIDAPSERIQVMNEPLRRRLGYTIQDYTSQFLAIRDISVANVEEVQKYFITRLREQLKRGKTTFGTNTVVKAKDGRWVPCFVTIIVTLDPNIRKPLMAQLVFSFD